MKEKPKPKPDHRVRALQDPAEQVVHGDLPDQFEQEGPERRPDPVRVAEEMAWLDILSGGRLEMGLVKGAPYEIAPANSNPANLMRRYWEAHDLILKAMSTTDGPFSWEGEFFHYRNVKIWPRPYQQPTPPGWRTGPSPETGRMAAEHGHVVGTLLWLAAAGPMFDAYRKRGQE